jgi:K+-transporting ATPase ATPase C chain
MWELIVSLSDEPVPPDVAPPPPLLDELRAQLRPLFLAVPLLTLLTGVVFPLIMAAFAVTLFPYQAGGSLVVRDGIVVGSELIGQDATSPGYFHPRPSAAGKGYDGTASGGTNLGPSNRKLHDDVRELADAYRQSNGLPSDAAVPIDAVTRSGSGLDPDINPANADLQVPRVAGVRHLPEEQVRRLIRENTRGRQLGFLGEPRVNVFALNLALDRTAPANLPPQANADHPRGPAP